MPVAGGTTYTCQLRAFVEQIRGEMTFPTDGAEGVIHTAWLSDRG